MNDHFKLDYKNQISPNTSCEFCGPEINLLNVTEYVTWQLSIKF